MSTLKALGMDATTGQLKYAVAGDTLSGFAVHSGTPALAVGAQSGAGATTAIVGNNYAGKITLNSGTGVLTAGVVLTMTFADGLSWPTGSFVTFTAGNAALAAIMATLYVTTTQTTAVLNVTAGLAISTAFVGFYHVAGY